MEYAIIVLLLILISISLYFLYKKNVLEMEKSFKEKEKEIEDIKQSLEDQKKEFQDEQDSITQSICEEVKQLDQELTKRVQDIDARCTVHFECPCENQTIVMQLDLSKDKEGNIYTCPECGNEYYVNINLIPTLKEKIVNEQAMYDLLTKKYNHIKINE